MDPATNESLNDEPKLIPKTPLFTRPAFLSLTIGVPFCIFKILFGIQFIRAADIHSQPWFIYAGWILIAWAGVDMVMNLSRAGLDLIGSGNKIEFCSGTSRKIPWCTTCIPLC